MMMIIQHIAYAKNKNKLLENLGDTFETSEIESMITVTH